MRVLLDNCIDVRAAPLFHGHDVSHAQDRKWAELTNGKLMAAAAAAGYDVLVTVDQGIRYETNLDNMPLPVVELKIFSNTLENIRSVAPHFSAALELTSKCNFVSIDHEGRIETLADRRLATPSERVAEHTRDSALRTHAHAGAESVVERERDESIKRGVQLTQTAETERQERMQQQSTEEIAPSKQKEKGFERA